MVITITTKPNHLRKLTIPEVCKLCLQAISVIDERIAHERATQRLFHVPYEDIVDKYVVLMDHFTRILGVFSKNDKKGQPNCLKIQVNTALYKQEYYNKHMRDQKNNKHLKSVITLVKYDLTDDTSDKVKVEHLLTFLITLLTGAIRRIELLDQLGVLQRQPLNLRRDLKLYTDQLSKMFKVEDVGMTSIGLIGFTDITLEIQYNKLNNG